METLFSLSIMWQDNDHKLDIKLEENILSHFAEQRSATKVTFPLVWTNTSESELIDEKALAQRKLLDELSIQVEDVPVDEFMPLGRILYKAPSDGNLSTWVLLVFLFKILLVLMQFSSGL
ncbi:hypothetical protein RJ641_024425, partial [Dillenia turbinata]